ncbi:hypothetical protein WS67_01465 [Burkholderia singularis]|uniref:Uncharacterized protein n=1 Tax=Burkholderia singularis TaxID=1503053 RepID=A0A103DXL2_9BURK|nr:hypothetical protein AQ611_05820 [Burkholderia sp. Bp7605]KVE24256.1 hypothetical protein WS67_01465 [Burkholderia singularis]
MVRSSAFGGGCGGRQRSGRNGGRAGKQHVSATRRGNGVGVGGTHGGSLNVRYNNAALVEWRFAVPACGNRTGSRRARERSERMPTAAYPATMRFVLKSR